ncbi:hypothetical protein GBAR_LOCUS11258, partial [Geodia barretti]
ARGAAECLETTTRVPRNSFHGSLGGRCAAAAVSLATELNEGVWSPQPSTDSTEQSSLASKEQFLSTLWVRYCC